MIYISNSNGDKVLALQPMSCILSVSINGAWVLKIEHPYDVNDKWKSIKENAVISVDVDCFDWVNSVNPEQLYRIKFVQIALNSIYAEAYPIALDAFDEAVITSLSGSYTATGLAQALNNVSNKYTVSTSLTSQDYKEVEYKNTNLIAAINGGEGCFAELFGGEIGYDDYHIYLKSSLGDSDTTYIYAGRDVSSLVHTINTSDVITRVYPISANGTRLPSPGYVNSPLISSPPHCAFIDTIYMLCTDDEKNPDKLAYSATMEIKEALDSQLQTIRSLLLSSEYWEASNCMYKRNIDYLHTYLKYTKNKNKWRGIIERMQLDCTSEITNKAFKQMVNGWISETIIGIVDDIEEDTDEFVVKKITVSGDTKYIYCEKDDTSNRVKSEWVHLDNKWRYFNSNGYLVPSKDDNHRWSWFTRNGYKYYGYKGETAAEDIRVKNQWLKVNGTWYWFKSGDPSDPNTGTHDPAKTTLNNINLFFSRELVQSLVMIAPMLASGENNLTRLMHSQMISYVEHLYDNGIDKPKLEINLEAIDISEIEGYERLKDIKLGNNVVFRNNGTNISERIVELDFDCIRRKNTRIVLGMPTETISAIISRNINTTPQLTAGYGVSIDGNVINIADGGGNQQPGLRYWEETQSHIERQLTSVPLGGWTCDDTYLLTGNPSWSIGYDEGSLAWTEHFYKINGGKAVGAFMHFWNGGGRVMSPVILSPVRDDVQIHFSRGTEQGDICYGYSNTISYGGLNWYISGSGIESEGREFDPNADLYEPSDRVQCWDSSWTDYEYLGGLPEITTVFDGYYEAIMGLLGIAHVRTRDSYLTGINVGDAYPFYGGYVASGSMTPENCPYKVKSDGTIYGKDVIAGNHRLSNKQDKLTAGQNIQINNNVISATDTTYSDFAGSTHGLVPPVSTQAGKFLKDDGSWDSATEVSITPTISTGTKIADYEIDGVSGELYAPSGGGSSDLDAIELTKAQYNALTPAEKADADKIYFLSDGDLLSESLIIHTTDIVYESQYDDYYIDSDFTSIVNALNDGKIVYLIDTLGDIIPRIYKLSGIVNSSTLLSFTESHGDEILEVDSSVITLRIRRGSIQSTTPTIVRLATLQYNVQRVTS